KLYAQLFELSSPTPLNGQQVFTVQAINPIHSSGRVDDGALHHARLVVSGNSQTLTLDGTTVGTLSGRINPVASAFVQLGTGYTAGWAGGNTSYDPFVGTIGQLQITRGTLPTGTLTFPNAGGNQVIFIAPDAETFTVSLRAGDKHGGIGGKTVWPAATTA